MSGVSGCVDVQGRKRVDGGIRRREVRVVADGFSIARDQESEEIWTAMRLSLHGVFRFWFSVSQQRLNLETGWYGHEVGRAKRRREASSKRIDVALFRCGSWSGYWRSGHTRSAVYYLAEEAGRDLAHQHH